MSQNNSEEISVQQVFNAISNYLKSERLFEKLLNVLHEEKNYKDLLETGGNQFFDAPNESTIELESEKSRSSCNKISELALTIEKGMDKIVQERFQGEFLNKLKDKVLQAVLLLSSEQKNNSDITSQASVPPVKSRKNKKGTHLSQTLNNNCVQNKKNKKKEASNVINGQAGSSLQDWADVKLGKNYGDPDLSGISFEIDSVSSVHTSDLSSFEDVISLSSDEEIGRKRRLSLKEVQDKLEKSKLEEMDYEENNEEANLNQNEDAQSNSLVNNKESSSMSQKSNRRRKPNLKYTDDDSPFKKKFVKVHSSSRSVCGDLPRKRGRPRKYST